MDRRINRTYLVKLLQSLLPHWMEADSQPPATSYLLVLGHYNDDAPRLHRDEEAFEEERHAKREEEGE